jgi:hypothetical protein
MKKKSSNLLIRKENYRLWFEFYKLCCLSDDLVVKSNLKHSKNFYDQWDDVINAKFDDWWKTHSRLFEQPVVKVVKSEDEMESPYGILIEVPLNQSVTETLSQLKDILASNQKPLKRKRKTTFIGKYQLTEHSEPKLKTIRSVLSIYRDVYLKNRRLKIPKLLPLVHKYYDSRARMRLPNSLFVDKDQINLDNALRNLGRWMKWGKTIMLNVSKGEFPGRY